MNISEFLSSTPHYWLFVVPIALIIWAARNLFSTKRSPCSLLVDVVAINVDRSWRAMAKAPVRIDGSSARFVAIAQHYVSLRDKALQKRELEAEQEQRNELWSRKRSVIPESEDLSPIAMAVLLTVLVTFAGCAVVAVAYVVSLVLMKSPSAALFVLGVGLLLLGIQGFLIRFAHGVLMSFAPKHFEFSLAFGSLEHWRLLQWATSRECEQQQRVLLSMMSNAQNPGDTGRPEDDPNIKHTTINPWPIPPGITEISLMHRQDALHEIRKHLKSTRTFHRTIAISSFILFVLSLSLALYGTLFLNQKSFASVFGGVGLGAVLATFSYFTMVQARISQIALALFESYVAELRENLEESDTSLDDEIRRNSRATAWMCFRVGLNSLWEMEQNGGAKRASGRKRIQKG